MNIVGLNAYHGDVAAVLVRDGQLIAAVEEERYRRIKHWAGCPRDSLNAVLEMGGIRADQVDHFAVSRNPKANLFRKAMFALKTIPSAGLVRDRLKNRESIRNLAGSLAANLGIAESFVSQRMHWVEHHPAHLASAFYVSPFEEAAVCAIDGFGDFVSTSFATGRGANLKVIERVLFPHSLGLLYLAITQYLGFTKYGDEFKVMGLAPYGKPRYANQLRKLLRLTKNGLFELELEYFRHWSDGVAMTWDDGEPTMGPVYSRKFEELLGPARNASESVTEREADIAASLQVVHEEAVFHLLNELHRRTKLEQLCLAGGCAMNSVANGKIRANTPFRHVYIQPASGDNGTALGAAYHVWHQVLGKPRSFQMEHGYWGPESCNGANHAALDERRADLEAQHCVIKEIADETELCRWTGERIAQGRVVGWYQGRMEWGARALGNRSIVADPRRANMREIINTKIKFREKFRPFAPSVLEDALDDYFVDARRDPFMIQVYPVRPEKRAVIPAVTHVDGSGRLQTVSERTNPRYYRLISEFKKLTGVPVVLNTSFNENEPIVLTPAQALDCFLRTRMDHIVLGNITVSKGE
jgi:carbamoyltransferase